MHEALAANKHLLQRLLTRQQNQTSENKSIVTEVGELKHAQMKMQSEMASSFADLHAAIASRKTDNKRGAPEKNNHPSRHKHIIAEGLGQYSVLQDVAFSPPCRKAPVASQVDFGCGPDIAVLQLQPAGRGRHGQRHVRLASPPGSASGSYADEVFDLDDASLHASILAKTHQRFSLSSDPGLPAAAFSPPSRKAPVSSQVDLAENPDIVALQWQPAGRGRNGQSHANCSKGTPPYLTYRAGMETAPAISSHNMRLSNGSSSSYSTAYRHPADDFPDLEDTLRRAAEQMNLPLPSSCLHLRT